METVYLLAPLLLLGVVLAAVWLDRWSVPVILVALGVGIVCGSDVLGLWHFDNVGIANELANAGLVFILFQGGLSTKRTDFRAVALAAGGMATWGVVLTAAVTFGVLHLLLGWSAQKALLLGVVISSTDAAATFSMLRRHALPARLSATIEVESAANDPMAILLTLFVVQAMSSGAEGSSLAVLGLFVWKFVAGPVVGWLMARGALAIFDRLNPQDRGYYYVLLLATVLLTYGVAEVVQASGMLAVFAAGLVMGNRHFIYQQGVRNFSAALAMIANVGLFVMMGLLVFPGQWGSLWLDGVVLFLALTFVARPAAVWIGTAGMRIGVRERHFMCWAGLRGAVPIVLATYPMAAGLPVGQDVFNLVFFAVLLSVAIQGSTLGLVAERLGLSRTSRPQPRYGLELITMAQSELDLFVVDLPGPQGRPGPRIRDLVLPSRALLTLVARGSEVVAPTGNTRLRGWDQVTVLARRSDEEVVRAALLEPFERTSEEDEGAARVLDTLPGDAPAAPADRDRAGGVVLLGHGRVGAVLAGLLQQRGYPFVVVEQDDNTVEHLQRAGTRVVQGDGSDPEVLRQAGIEAARLLLITSAEPLVARHAIEHAQRLNPAIEVVTRVHHEVQRRALSALPRTQCVQGEVELAYAMARLMLLAVGVSVVETEALMMDARRGEGGAGRPRTRITEILVPTTSAVVGRTVADLRLPRGALVVTIARAGEFVVPGGATVIQADDALLVLADAEAAQTIQRVVAEPTPATAPPPV